MTYNWQIFKASFAGLEHLGELYAELDRRIATWQTTVGLVIINLYKGV